jgi:hypothetical protein
MFRGKVTAVTDAGVYVLCADVASTPIGPCQAVVASYTVGDAVLVVNVGTDVQPDLVVVGKVTTDSTQLAVKAAVSSRPPTGDANLTAASVDANAGNYLVGLAGKWRSVYFCTNVAGDQEYRWNLGSTDDAESGSNAGSNFYLARWGDGWSFLSYSVKISRATGRITLGDVGPTAGIELGSGGPTITTGTGAPSHSAPNGSTYHRTDGTASTTLYVRAAGAWTALS